jgi:hypothetical protein
MHVISLFCSTSSPQPLYLDQYSIVDYSNMAHLSLDTFFFTNLKMFKPRNDYYLENEPLDY